MGWRSISKTGEIRYEGHENPELGGRPVAQGEEGNLLWIEQEDYGHRVGIDLAHGVIFIDYPEPATFQNGTLEIGPARSILIMCDDTNVVGEMAHNNPIYELKRDEKGRKVRDENGKLVQVKTDVLTPLTFRPIWFTRHISTLPAPLKVVGLQTTVPQEQGGHNTQKMVILYPTGAVGIA